MVSPHLPPPALLGACGFAGPAAPRHSAVALGPGHSAGAWGRNTRAFLLGEIMAWRCLNWTFFVDVPCFFLVFVRGWVGMEFMEYRDAEDHSTWWLSEQGELGHLEMGVATNWGQGPHYPAIQ